jgi:hypothetical protein
VAAPTGTVRLTKNLRKERGIASFAVGQQHQIVWSSQTGSAILKQRADQGFVASALHMGDDELADRVHQFCFPGRRSFVGGIAVSLIGLDCLDFKRLRLFNVKGLSMFAQTLIQAAHCARIHLDQTRGPFQRAAFGQMFTDRHCLRFAHFCVPQGTILTLAEFGAADATTQIANPVGSVHLAHNQVALTGLPVQFAARLDTC